MKYIPAACRSFDAFFSGLNRFYEATLHTCLRLKPLVLLAAGADVNATDQGGTTALMAASALGHGDLVDLLLVAGADVNLKDAAGKSALARATLAGHSEIVDALKAAGAVEEGDAKKE